MGLASEGKQNSPADLGVLEGLHELLNEEDTNPIYQVNPDNASTEEIRLLKEAGWRKLEIVIRIVEQTVKTRAFLETYMAPLNERIRRTDNLDKLHSDLTTTQQLGRPSRRYLLGLPKCLNKNTTNLGFGPSIPSGKRQVVRVPLARAHTFVQPFKNFHRAIYATGCVQCVPCPTGF